MKILVTPTSMQKDKDSKAVKRLTEFASEVIYNPYGRPLTEDELIPILKECDGFIAGLDNITAKVLSECKNLKVVSRYGAGVDKVDLEAAKDYGIAVTNTPGVNAVAVAELSFALILNLARRISMLDKETKAGEWVRSYGMELGGKTIGILGLGAIGRNVARYAQGFNMNVMAYDPYIDEEYAKENDIVIASLDEIFVNADVISLHLPLTDETRNLINADTINKMKDSAIIINTSRGGIIDKYAAYKALLENRLGGLGLDAFEEEPPKKSPLFDLDNVILTPHTGAHTREAIDNMANLSVENLINVISGNECKYIVNK